MANNLQKISSNKHFEGTLTKYKFKVCIIIPWPGTLLTMLSSLQSAALGGLDAQFNLFLPGNAAHGKVPVLFYLSGLTCTEDNALSAFVQGQR